MDKKSLISMLLYLYKSGVQDGLEYGKKVLKDESLPGSSEMEVTAKKRVDEALDNFFNK